MPISAAALETSTTLVLNLLNAGIEIVGVAAAAVKTVIGLFHTELTDAEIDAAFQAVLAQDAVILAAAQQQSGGAGSSGSPS